MRTRSYLLTKALLLSKKYSGPILIYWKMLIENSWKVSQQKSHVLKGILLCFQERLRENTLDLICKTISDEHGKASVQPPT